MSQPAFAYIRAENSKTKYQYNKRRIEQRDQFTTASGSTTFDRRAEYLREAHLKRIEEDIQTRQFSGVRRTTQHFWDRENRSGATTRRRIDHAKRQGGIRLRRNASTIRQLGNFTSEEKAAQIKAYREAVRERESGRYNPKTYAPEECASLLGRRQATCFHQQRQD